MSFDMDDARRQHWLPFHEKLAYRSPAEFAAQHNLWLAKWRNAYWLSHRLLGSRAKVIYGDVYEFPQEAGQFDVVFICSILEHLADPIRALASIARVSASEIVITTPAIKTEDKIAHFDGDASRPDVDFTWWTYSIGTYRHILRMLGFGIVGISDAKYRFELADSLESRTTIVAKRGAVEVPASPDPNATGAGSKWPWRRKPGRPAS